MQYGEFIEQNRRFLYSKLHTTIKIQKAQRFDPLRPN